MIMTLLVKVLLGISKTGIYVLVAELFLGRTATLLHDKKVYFVSAIIAIVLSASNYYGYECLVTFAPFVVLVSLTILGILTEGKKKIVLSLTSAIESYVVSFMFGLIFIVISGLLSKIGFNAVSKYDKYIWVIGIRTVGIVLIWIK